MLGFFISCLIVYGMTLILVQGAIFSNIKKQLSELIKYLEKYYNPELINVDDLIRKNHKYISEQHIGLYNNLISKITQPNNTSKSEELGNLLTELVEKIKQIIIEKRQYKFIFKFAVWILNSLQYLINCMMCSGLWCGIILCIITLNFNISICGSLLNLVTTQGDFSTCITVFLLGCVFSGTTWAINALVDFFVVIKDSLQSYLDKKTSE